MSTDQKISGFRIFLVNVKVGQAEIVMWNGDQNRVNEFPDHINNMNPNYDWPWKMKKTDT